MRLRLLADDLTGALDSAAQFVPASGPITTVWTMEHMSGSIAFDAGTREVNTVAARETMQRVAPVLDGGEPAFKKVDSLLRGHVAVELAVCLKRFDHCVLAPAFPFQGRVTTGGRQMLRGVAIEVDLAAELAAHGVPVTLCRPGDAAPAGVSLWDAATDGDLSSIVAAGRDLPGRVLWSGTGGLAGALAGRIPVPRPVLKRPILALIGSDHATSHAQFAACATSSHRIGVDAVQAIAATLANFGAAAVMVDLPSGTPRTLAARRIAESFGDLLRQLPRLGSLFVAGGATLRDLCQVVGAVGLVVDGEIEPGVPCSVLRGGWLDGRRIVSKSGAFGEPQFLARLLANG
jgi:uncharacterized protein YgbK (DUF1537 family)